MWAQEHADARVDYALDDRYRENAKQGQDQGQFPWPYGTASDSAAASGPIPPIPSAWRFLTTGAWRFSIRGST